MPQSPTAESFVTLLGGFPVDLPRIMSRLDVVETDRLRRYHIEYTSLGEARVPAFMLIPKGYAGLRPAVLAIHQDSPTGRRDLGKSESAGLAGDPGLQYGLEICLRGYVVCCPDRIGCESRQGQTWDAQEVPLRRELYDLRRAIDCLAAWPEVDATNLGVIGHSAGGWLSALAAFVDRRIGVVVASCGTWLWRWSREPKPARLAGLNVPKPRIPGLEQWGDQDDILAGIAPRPYLETGDPWPPEEEEELYCKARNAYGLLGVPDRFAVFRYAAGHSFRQDMRERSYAWLDRWLDVH